MTIFNDNVELRIIKLINHTLSLIFSIKFTTFSIPKTWRNKTRVMFLWAPLIFKLHFISNRVRVFNLSNQTLCPSDWIHDLLRSNRRYSAVLFVQYNIRRNYRGQSQTSSEHYQPLSSPFPNSVGQKCTDNEKMEITRQVPRRDDTLNILREDIISYTSLFHVNHGNVHFHIPIRPCVRSCWWRVRLSTSWIGIFPILCI